MTFDEVRALALALPGVVEGESHRTPTFRVRGKPIARRHDDPDVLVLRVSAGAKEALVEANPRAFFGTPHDDGPDWVLVRLPKVKRGELRDLLFEAHRLCAPPRGLFAKVRAIFLALPDVEEHLSQFGARPAFWIGGREIAHFHDGAVEIRVGKRHAKNGRDWVELPLSSKRDLAVVAASAEIAARENRIAGLAQRRPRGRRH